MRPNLAKPNFRTVVDLGFRSDERRSLSERSLRDYMSSTVLSLGVWIGSLLVGSIAIRSVFGTTVALIAVAALTREPAFAIFASLSAILSFIVWRRRHLVPNGVAMMSAALAPGEAILGDGLALEESRRRHRHSVKILAVTDRRLMVGTVATKDENRVESVPIDRILGYDFSWSALGNSGELTLQSAHPVDIESQRAWVKYVRITPSSLVGLVDALRQNGVAGRKSTVIRV